MLILELYHFPLRKAAETEKKALAIGAYHRTNAIQVCLFHRNLTVL